MQTKQWIIAGLLLTGLLVLLFALSSILLPFIVGLLLAYFLDPVVDRLELLKLSRGVSTAIVLGVFSLVLLGVLMVVAPLVYTQLMDLIAQAPEYLRSLRLMLEGRFQAAGAGEQVEKVKELVNGNAGQLSQLASYVPKVLQGVWQSGMALINLLSLLFVTPVVAFYLLRDWDLMVAKVDSLLPHPWAADIREISHRVDHTVSGFIRGYTNVCFMLAVYYAISLTLVGLDYGLLIGLLAGLLAFLPYVGTLFGTMTAVMVAWFQFQDIKQVAIVLAIFGVAQVVEGNLITPKLVGDRIGLHPVWLIFGMLAGGVLLGLVGILIAVPVTAIIGVLIRYGLEKYKKSSLYRPQAEGG